MTSDKTYGTVDHATDFAIGPEVVNIGLDFGSLEGDRGLKSPSNYEDNSEYIALITRPIIVNAALPTVSYQDIAIVEPTNDEAVLEGTLDGVNWVEIDSYDASFDPKWTTLFESGEDPSSNDLVTHVYNLTDHFNDGDKILLRFRLTTNESVNAWGWFVDNLRIQLNPTATNAKLDADVSLYPNPSITGNLNINVTEKLLLKVYDMSGRLQLSQKLESGATQIDVSRFNSGVYSLTFESAAGTTSRKIVINN